MSNSFSFKTKSTVNNDILPITKENIQEIPIKPIIKHSFNEKAKENNAIYQDLRKENKTLNQLNKMYNKTKMRNDIFKAKLINNPSFAEDYDRILEAYNNGVKLDKETINILEVFNFEPLE